VVSARGLSNEAIAAARHTRPATFSKWRNRFLAWRLESLGDAARGGKPSRHDARTDQRVLQQLNSPSPTGYGRWNGHLLVCVHRSLRCPQAADVVDLYPL
jgi:transposase